MIVKTQSHSPRKCTHRSARGGQARLRSDDADDKRKLLLSTQHALPDGAEAYLALATRYPAKAEGVWMRRRPRTKYTETQKALMWERWKKGETLHQIARTVGVGRLSRAVRYFQAPTLKGA